MAPSNKSQQGTVANLAIRVVENWDELEELKEEWNRLASNAIERSPSSEAWMLIPALRYLLSGEEIRVLLVFAESGRSDAREELCGVFALEICKKYKGLTLPVVRLWNHRYSLSPVPLVHGSLAADCLRALFRWVKSEFSGPVLFEFPELRSESAFVNVLTDLLREDELESRITEMHSRAFFRPRQNADTYLSAISTGHHRHEMRRQERRLAEMGQLNFRHAKTNEEVTAWLNEFVALESSGWKGRHGTAFGSKAGDLAFLEEVVHAAAQREELMLLGLWLDDKPLALKLNFLCGEGGYTFKIAYDEAYAKYSPGVLLELENIRETHAKPEVRWLDSLALPNHPMANRLWLDRTAIVTLLVAPGRPAGRIILGLLPLLGAVKRMFRRAA